jgi:hypothetical protein
VGAVLLALSPSSFAQVPMPSPNTPAPLGGRPADPPPISLEGHYGPPEPADLEDVADGSRYLKRNVIVKGIVGSLASRLYLSLTEGQTRVMLIPYEPEDYQDLATLTGVDVEVTGIVRALPPSQKSVPCYGGVHLESKCDDYLLPELPNAQPGWPAISITVVKISDRGKTPLRRPGRNLAETGIDSAAAAGKPVRALGQFRGADLCRDLPSTTRRDPADWVLLTSEGPVWVTGHRPEGSGFHLDPAYRGDTARWLEVTAKVEKVGEVRYLKASKVSLIARPEDASAAACPP